MDGEEFTGAMMGMTGMAIGGAVAMRTIDMVDDMSHGNRKKKKKNGGCGCGK